MNINAQLVGVETQWEEVYDSYDPAYDGSGGYGGYNPDYDFDLYLQAGGYSEIQDSVPASIHDLEQAAVRYYNNEDHGVNTEILVLDVGGIEWTLTMAYDLESANESAMVTTKNLEGVQGPSMAWQIDKGTYDAWMIYPDGTNSHVLHQQAFEYIPLPEIHPDNLHLTSESHV